MTELDGYTNICSKITAYEACGLVAKALTEYTDIVRSIRDAANKGFVGVNVPDITISLSIRKRLEADGFSLTNTKENATWIYWGE